MIDHDRFAALAEAYGGDIAQWPHAEQAAALDYADLEPERAQARLSEAAGLDRLLAGVEPARPAAGLEAAILAAAPGADVAGQPRARLAGLAAGLALMVGAGAGWVAAPANDPYAEPAFAEAFGALERDDALDDIMPEDGR